MLNNANGFKKIYIATGYTDLRRGMEGLAAIIRFQFNLDPYDKDTLFLFCGKRTDRIKGLLWEGDGFLLFVQAALQRCIPVATVSGRGKKKSRRINTGC